MVTSEKTSEKKVGYRGSKSGVLKNILVKEQRINSSRYGKIFPYLRCILTGFEINFLIKNQSNLIIQRRLYSRRCEIYEDNSLTVKNKHTQLNEP